MRERDQRRDPRVPHAVPVKIAFGGPDDFLKAYTENISLGGVFVATNVKVPMGTKVDLTVELAPGKGMRVEAEVAWHRDATGDLPAGVGLRFVSMRQEYQTWLADQVAKYAEKHDRPEVTAAAPRAHQLRTAKGGDSLKGAVTRLHVEADPAAGPILGIDLGTSNTSVASLVDGEIRVLDIQDPPDGMTMSRAIPSVVAFDGMGKPTVGRKAVDELDSNARRTVMGGKRFIGLLYDSPTVQGMLSRFPYKVVPGPGGKASVDINNKPMSLSAVAAKILSYVQQLAGTTLGQRPNRAIITVPAFYNDNQRQAVVQAARLAGLEVLRIVNEPTAAAIAYGMSYVEQRTMLVYDLGGGTFDVSVMRVDGDKLSVLATAGDTFLGGEDFDDAIVRHVSQKFTQSTGKTLSSNHVALIKIKTAAERAKRRLSIHEKSMVTVREAQLASGDSDRFEVEITRQELESLVAPLVDRTLKICDMAVKEAGIASSDIADVLLVGGQTLMPYVQRRVGKHFGQPPRYDLSPDSVVALGAATLAHLSEPDQQKFQDVLSMSIGIELGGGRVKKLIPRNTPLPHRCDHTIAVPKDRFKGYSLRVCQGEFPEAARNEQLGTVSTDGIDPGPQDPVPMKVEFILTADCLLKVVLTNTATDASEDVLLDTVKA